MTCWSSMLIGVMALAALWSSQIVAAPKTDVVVLVNGDHITGEVKQLERGILTYSTDFMGTLKIEWDKIVQLRSDQLLEVEMLDGTRANGRPRELGERGALRLEADRGEPARPVALVSVARIFALDVGRLRDRLDGYVNVGWSAAAANDVSQLSVGAGLTYLDEIRLWDFSYVASRSDSATSPRTESQTLKIDQLRFLRDQWFWTGGGNISTVTSWGWTFGCCSAAASAVTFSKPPARSSSQLWESPSPRRSSQTVRPRKASRGYSRCPTISTGLIRRRSISPRN